jgi:coiled-coil and C2 domain-containing protein 2A
MASNISCRILWPDTNGVSYIVSRFVTEQRPPHKFKTPESCAHYVSLIPSLTGWMSIEKMNIDRNSVLTSQQTIDILAGKTKEHAVLLANFFLHLTKRDGDNSAEVYLVLGFAVPEGNTVSAFFVVFFSFMVLHSHPMINLPHKKVWVMRKCRRSKEIVFWESTSGCAYACEDDTSPLQRIYCLVSKEVRPLLSNIIVQ